MGRPAKEGANWDVITQSQSELAATVSCWDDDRKRGRVEGAIISLAVNSVQEYAKYT